MGWKVAQGHRACGLRPLRLLRPLSPLKEKSVAPAAPVGPVGPDPRPDNRPRVFVILREGRPKDLYGVSLPE